MNDLKITDIGLDPFGLTKEEIEILVKKYIWIKEKLDNECDLCQTVS